MMDQKKTFLDRCDDHKILLFIIVLLLMVGVGAEIFVLINNHAGTELVVEEIEETNNQQQAQEDEKELTAQEKLNKTKELIGNQKYSDAVEEFDSIEVSELDTAEELNEYLEAGAAAYENIGDQEAADAIRGKIAE